MCFRREARRRLDWPMLDPIRSKANKCGNLIGLMMTGTGAMVWFFAAYFLFCKVMHDTIRLAQYLLK